MPNTPAHSSHIALLLLLALAGCADDTVEPVPACNDIGHPLGVKPVISPPPPEFEVECAHGWGNGVHTRPVLDTVAMPERMMEWIPHPTDGWIVAFLPEYYPGWLPWLEERGVSTFSEPVMLWVRQDFSLGWVTRDFGFWDIELVGNEFWALAWNNPSDSHSSVHYLLVYDPWTGDMLDSRLWDLEEQNTLEAAADPAGGVWITTIEDREADDLVDQHLYRATTIDTIDLIATRTTEEPQYFPSGRAQGLPDGAAAWWTSEGFEIIEPDGSVRRTYPNGSGLVADGDNMLVTSQVPTGVGAGMALRLEKVNAADGSVIWSREHRRFDVVDPESCGPEGCTLVDAAYPVLRPDGGYLLVGRHAYPSSTCFSQPLIMAVSADGAAEWAHRVESCGRAGRAVFRSETTLEILGSTFTSEKIEGYWVRYFDL